MAWWFDVELLVGDYSDIYIYIPTLYKGETQVLTLNFSIPPIFPVHRQNFPVIMATSPETVAWSMMCPAELNSNPKYSSRKYEFGGSVPPHWDSSLLWLPVLGKYINALYNGLLMATPFEKVADFIAEDLLLGLDSQLIGMKVAPRPVPQA
jgi:hypothetical protein